MIAAADFDCMNKNNADFRKQASFKLNTYKPKENYYY